MSGNIIIIKALLLVSLKVYSLVDIFAFFKEKGSVSRDGDGSIGSVLVLLSRGTGSEQNRSGKLVLSGLVPQNGSIWYFRKSTDVDNMIKIISIKLNAG
ncbi:hypothetical protein RIR_jg31794.t1 [Rhizophagus irregularis DAOM 181602=DAOM 197198]|nr:hypothetical protein RIR_jg31794.t1 [Rhizophagus irregularis DAOM 181602=DAOM 197198]